MYIERLQQCHSSMSYHLQLRALLLTLHSERGDFPVLLDVYNELQGAPSIRNVARECVQDPGEG